MPINETIEEITKLTFEQATEVTQNSWFFVPLIILIAIPFLIYLIWGALANARTSSGQKIQGTNVIQTSNFWQVFIIFLFSLSVAIILIIFPVWLQFIN